ncbi:hypothetical protein CERSUDRAFT_113843 [Gelatoporia subvermispora B]|uniref:Uncharacterized protein n=1 Tax=Ceriporiopsis subvermispora (strain B) TaxID=914234 RepID=M2QNP0_CERS8|nr:hypothetical protein CERSUDRAFT_113843 [Gelatoporia subvermispora B]
MSRFTPSPAEVALVNQIFAQADTQKLGVITGEAAVKIFSGSKLSPTVLAEIWNVADEDNNGVLTRKGVAVAIRLLGHAQRGEKITEALVHKSGPPPTIEGLTPPVVPQSTGIRPPMSPPPGLPPLTPQDKAKFLKLFLQCGPANGLLSGEKARDVFVKSKLPVDKLSQIWNLADTKNRGALDATDFAIAMYLIQASMSGQLPNIPSTLPPSLYEQAGGKSPFEQVVSHATGDSMSYSPSLSGVFPGRPVSTIQPQFTGSGSILQPQLTGQLKPGSSAPPLPARSALGTSTSVFPFAQAPAAPSVQHWDVTPAEKESADRLFAGLDTQQRGYIEGDVAVPFMLQSKLPKDALAQIWDLADMNNDGRLTRDGFAVAMHLIQSKLNGKDLPSTVPASLIPPSMRGDVAPQPALPSESEHIRDLLWDDTPPSSATLPQPQPPLSVLQPQATGTLSPRATPAGSPPPRSHAFGSSDPFQSSPFAIPPRKLVVGGFGSPTNNSVLPEPAPAVHKDLLGDDDEHPAAAATNSPPLQDQSAEIGNVKIQLNSTNRSLETAKAERAGLEQALTEQAAQLSALQTQLSSAKAAYETENRLLTTLRERFSTQSTEIQKSRHELISAESELSGIRVEKAEVEGSVLRDKEEVRELQRKMKDVGVEVEGLKAEVEKLKKEAKQQKGLLAIAKKQLATREAERAKVEKELEDARSELQEAIKEREEAEAELNRETPVSLANGHSAMPVPAPSSPDSLAIAAAQPLPASPDAVPTSPTLSVKSTNPFERLAMASSQSRSSSPFLPFANSAVLPTPPTAPSAETQPAPEAPEAAEDPFGFSQAFEGDEKPATNGEAEGVEAATPRQKGPEAEEPETSPETDLFSTPPTTAMPTTATFPGSDSAEASRFPPVEAFGSPAPDAQVPSGEKGQVDTDLDHQLKELDVNESESDSDSDSDEDNEPLTSVKAKLTGDAASASTAGKAEPSAPAAISAFDDSFGISSTEEPSTPSTTAAAPAPAPAQAPSAPQDGFGNAFTPLSIPQESAVAAVSPAKAETPKTNGTAEAGVSDFDEAMGKLSAPSSSGPSSQFSQFTFDSAFDDNFDFAAASSAAPQPLTNGSTASTSTASPAPAANPQVGFDSIFMSQPSGSLSAPQATPAAVPAPIAPAPTFPSQGATAEKKPFSFEDAFGTTNSHVGPSNSSQVLSFDDAFGGAAPAEALAFDSSFGSPKQTPINPPGSQTSMAAFPTSPAPSSPHGTMSPPLSARRSISPPPRHVSPPPRHSSPKPRPSTASSDKEKGPSTRHSKLSIRLPFGRKKAKHDAPPVPSSLAQSQVIEDPTPAVEDDVEAVKTLCGMGFSRTQAVTALEQQGYDVQRALNSLLGTP